MLKKKSLLTASAVAFGMGAAGFVGYSLGRRKADGNADSKGLQKKYEKERSSLKSLTVEESVALNKWLGGPQELNPAQMDLLRLGTEPEEPSTSKKYNWNFNWDFRQPFYIEESVDDVSVKQLPTRHVILIRHGQFDTSGRSDKNHKLTALGKEQARLTAQRLRELGYPYQLMVNSTMRRAQETADIIAEELATVPRQENMILREGTPHVPEPRANYWKPPSDIWYHNARMEAAFKKYFHRPFLSQTNDSYEVIVCHGNLIRYLVCRLLQFPPEAWMRMSVAHASITWTTIHSDGSVQVKSIGESSHIPVDKVSGFQGFSPIRPRKISGDSGSGIV